jgi:hypothetical protein
MSSWTLTVGTISGFTSLENNLAVKGKPTIPPSNATARTRPRETKTPVLWDLYADVYSSLI